MYYNNFRRRTICDNNHTRTQAHDGITRFDTSTTFIDTSQNSIDNKTADHPRSSATFANAATSHGL